MDSHATSGHHDAGHHEGTDTCVARVPIFSRLTPAQQLEVAGFATPRTVERGQALVRAAQASAPLFVVHSGRVKLSRTSPDGRETITQVLEPGDVGGEVWFLTGGRPDDDAVALSDTQACLFEPDALGALLRRYPDIGAVMLRTLAERVRSAERMLAARTLADVGARVAAYLLDLPAPWDAAGVASVRLPLAKKEIANYLGTSPETLSRRLASLEEAGLIRVRGADIDLLDAAGLDLRSRGV